MDEHLADYLGRVLAAGLKVTPPPDPAPQPPPIQVPLVLDPPPTLTLPTPEEFRDFLVWLVRYGCPGTTVILPTDPLTPTEP